MGAVYVDSYGRAVASGVRRIVPQRTRHRHMEKPLSFPLQVRPQRAAPTYRQPENTERTIQYGKALEVFSKLVELGPYRWTLGLLSPRSSARFLIRVRGRPFGRTDDGLYALAVRWAMQRYGRQIDNDYVDVVVEDTHHE
jgi:hypothetical protein